MKTAILTILVFGFVTSLAFADCTITVNWTPSADPNAATQEVFYDPDNTVGGDEQMKQGGDMTLNSYAFTITAPVANDEVWVKTLNADQSDVADSVHVPVGGVVGATSISVTTVCQ